MSKKPDTERYKQAAQNKKARHDYTIEETFEAGLMLTGTEVKSLREGKANIKDSHAVIDNSQPLLLNSYIPEYKQGSFANHMPRRPRKLLLHKQEIKKLIGKVKEKGFTLVPLSIYFNAKGIAKVEIGLATGKKQHEKREAQKEKDWKRKQNRIMKENN